MAFVGERQKCGSGPCCGGQCTIFADTFDRTDDDSLGSDWTEVAGDFDIASNELSTATANSLAIANTAHPDSLTTGFITVSIASCGSGTVVRVIGNYLNASNYHAVNVTCNSSSATITLIRRAGGTNTTLATKSIGSGDWTSNVTIKVCLTTASIAAEVVGPSSQYLSQVATPIDGGYKAGVGTVAVSGTLAIAGFTFQRMKDATHLTCNGCESPCTACSDDPPAILKAVVTGNVDGDCGDCEQMNGTFFLLPAGDCRWCTAVPGELCDPTRSYFNLCVQISYDAFSDSFILTANVNRFLLVHPTDPDKTVTNDKWRLVIEDVLSPVDCEDFFTAGVTLPYALTVGINIELCQQTASTVTLSLP